MRNIRGKKRERSSLYAINGRLVKNFNGDKNRKQIRLKGQITLKLGNSLIIFTIGEEIAPNMCSGKY